MHSIQINRVWLSQIGSLQIIQDFFVFLSSFLGNFLQRRFRFSLLCCCDGSSFVSILTNASMHIILCFCRYFFSARKRLSICPLQSCSDKAKKSVDVSGVLYIYQVPFPKSTQLNYRLQHRASNRK